MCFSYFGHLSSPVISLGFLLFFGTGPGSVLVHNSLPVFISSLSFLPSFRTPTKSRPTLVMFFIVSPPGTQVKLAFQLFNSTLLSDFRSFLKG
jgi:hypothetical protein